MQTSDSLAGSPPMPARDTPAEEDTRNLPGEALCVDAIVEPTSENRKVIRRKSATSISYPSCEKGGGLLARTAVKTGAPSVLRAWMQCRWRRAVPKRRDRRPLSIGTNSGSKKQ